MNTSDNAFWPTSKTTGFNPPAFFLWKTFGYQPWTMNKVSTRKILTDSNDLTIKSMIWYHSWCNWLFFFGSAHYSHIGGDYFLSHSHVSLVIWHIIRIFLIFYKCTMNFLMISHYSLSYSHKLLNPHIWAGLILKSQIGDFALRRGVLRCASRVS